MSFYCQATGTGMMEWNDGMMEWWNDGMME
jgi:hypothetical protein